MAGDAYLKAAHLELYSPDAAAPAGLCADCGTPSLFCPSRHADREAAAAEPLAISITGTLRDDVLELCIYRHENCVAAAERQQCRRDSERGNKTMRHLIAAAVSAVALAGCTTPAVETQFRNSAVVDRGESQVWSDLVSYFTRNNIQIRTIERDSGVIYAERARFSDDLASCESNSLLSSTTDVVSLNVFVRPASRSQTQVTINTDFRRTGFYDGNAIPLTCYSKGAIEGEILSAIGGG